jgi:hypothetical protein
MPIVSQACGRWGPAFRGLSPGCEPASGVAATRFGLLRGARCDLLPGFERHVGVTGGCRGALPAVAVKAAQVWVWNRMSHAWTIQDSLLEYLGTSLCD